MNLPIPVGAKLEAVQNKVYKRVEVIVSLMIPRFNHARQIRQIRMASFMEMFVSRSKDELLREFWRKLGAL